MALEFGQTIDGPQKLRFSKDQESKFTEEEKADLQEMRDKGYLTSKESEMGIAEKVIPEQEVVNEQEVVDDPQIIKTKDGKFSIDIMGALTNVGDAAGSALSSIGDSASQFVQGVGSNLSAIAEAVPNKIEEIASDPTKKKNFMRGLNIINESSGIKPIGQAKSDIGAIAGGLLKAEKGFIATDIARLKAQKKEPRRYPSPNETLLTETFGDYKKADKDKLKAGIPVATRYNLARKVAMDGNELPTGILNKSFSDIKAFLSEVPGGEELYNSLSLKFEDTNYGTKMKLEDQVIFNDLFQAATYQQVVKQVKELYPVSNKDIDTLLKTKGDIGSKPEALMKLIAAEMATKEIYMGSRNLATLYFKNDDLDFEQKSILGSEKIIAEKLRKENKVTNSSIEELFGKGSAESVTDAGYITAYYYQNLKSQKVEGAGDPFTIFVTAKKEKIEKIEKIIDDIQNDKDTDN